MKHLNDRVDFLTVLLACLGVMAAAQPLQAQQVRSDYQIQSDFKTEYRSISTSLDEAENVATADTLIAEIRTLEMQYSEDEDLLDKALYPDTFDERIENLKKRAISVQARLATIRNQDQRLQELTEEVSDYSDQLARLTSRADSIRQAMQQSVQSEEQLAEEVQRYRQSLEQRDELILSIIDSVLVTYREMDIETLADMENASTRTRINAEDNPLDLIQTIADENVEFMNSNPNLSTNDYLRMNVVQQEFSSMWSRVGSRLTEIYSEDPRQASSNIENSIGTWAEQIQSNLWGSVHKSFEQTGIDLQPFGDSQAFATELNRYVDQGLAASRDNGNQQTYQNYQNFSNFWNNQVKRSWGEFLRTLLCIYSESVCWLS